MADDRQIRVSADLSVTLHSPDKPTWSPTWATATEIVATAMRMKGLYVRHLDELDAVILAVSPLIPRKAKAKA